MNTYKPITLIYVGSFIAFLLSIIACCCIDFYIQKISIIVYIIVCLVIVLSNYVCFYFLFSKYLNTSLKIIYRKILSKNYNEIKDINLTQNVVNNLEKATEIWVENKQMELSKLKEQEKFIKDFLGNISHELKTPIFSIQGYILTLLEGGLEDEEVNRKFLIRASKSVDRITHLLSDLDTITKLESNEIEIKFEKFNLINLAKDVIDELQIKAKEKNVLIKKIWQKNEIMVFADRSKIAQVLTNLISNSIYYGNKNGVTEFRIINLFDGIIVEIADNGPGVEQKDLGRLFERFYRVEKSRARNKGGTGLGLAIVKHIIESHNQTISVRSTINNGTTFTFTLEKV